MTSSDYFSIQLPSILPAALTTFNWGGYYINAIGSVEDIINQGSSTPSELTLTYSFSSNCKAYFGALTALCLISTLLFFVASTLAQISILHQLHQVQNTGAPSNFYALQGFGNWASLVNMPSEAFSCRPAVYDPKVHLLLHRCSVSDAVGVGC